MNKIPVPYLKQTITIIILLSTFSLTSSFKPSINLYLSGKVYSNDTNISHNDLLGLYIFVKGDNKFITGSYVDTACHYDISFIPENQTSFDFFAAYFGDTTFIKSFTRFESDEMTWNIRLPNQYKKKADQVICPKCHHSDKVYRIVYGDAPEVRQKITNGDTTYTNMFDKKYYAGSCISNRLSPKWYCDRDKIKF